MDTKQHTQGWGLFKWAHICDNPNCEGPENLRRLEIFGELLTVCQIVAGWPHKDGECTVVDLARAAIAKASPQAPGPG
jgi:hypothetical protein